MRDNLVYRGVSRLQHMTFRSISVVKYQFRNLGPTTAKRWLLIAAFVVAVPLLPARPNATTQEDSIVSAKAHEPTAYKNLLNTIAKGESKGNYNAYFGDVDNKKIDFTAMTIQEVIDWQNDYVDNGSPSSAVGKYQIIRKTMHSLVRDLGVSKNAKFDEKMQDKFAVELLERRGLKDYERKKISKEKFANNLSKEWAALPKSVGKNPHISYYEHDGLNKAGISIDEFFTGIASVSS